MPGVPRGTIFLRNSCEKNRLSAELCSIKQVSLGPLEITVRNKVQTMNIFTGNLISNLFFRGT
jgi:hypothetical protein